MSALFDKSREKFLNGFISWQRDPIRVMLVNHGVDNPNTASDEWFSDISAGARVGDGGGSAQTDMPLLTSKTFTSGVADAADVTYTGIPAGPDLESVAVFREVPEASGTGNTIGTPDGNGLVTITDSAALFTAAMERGWFKIAGASNGANNGIWFIATYVSTTQIKIYNPAAITETSSFSWNTEAPLIAKIDTGTGLPVTPNGGPLTGVWDSGANKIFKL